MVPAEVRLVVRLYEEGVPIAEIARITGRSRQTIYNWLRKYFAGESFVHKAPRPSKLDPFMPYIESRLKRFDLPATVLLREIREQGYTGQISILRARVAEIKERHVRQLVARFETEPGLQAQVDWASCGKIWHRGKRRRLSLFLLVLGHSRFLWGQFVVTERRPQLMTLLEEAFREIGGVPREIVFDNMKQVVKLARTAEREATIQPEFLDFAGHWGFEVVACPAYWPRAKGKIERSIRYVKESFLEGRRFTDLADLNAQFREWLASVANVRVHGTTKERPVSRLAADLAGMLPLPAVVAYPSCPETTRRVTVDGRISVDGVLYSVDPALVDEARSVEVTIRRGGDGLLRVFHGAREVACHRLAPPGSPPQDLPEHVARRWALRKRPPRRPPRGKGPRFEQALPEVELLGVAGTPPEVEVRDLGIYGDLSR